MTMCRVGCRDNNAPIELSSGPFHLKKHLRSDLTCSGLTIVRFGPKEKMLFRSFSWSKSLIKKSSEQWIISWASVPRSGCIFSLFTKTKFLKPSMPVTAPFDVPVEVVGRNLQKITRSELSEPGFAFCAALRSPPTSISSFSAIALGNGKEPRNSVCSYADTREGYNLEYCALASVDLYGVMHRAALELAV